MSDGAGTADGRGPAMPAGSWWPAWGASTAATTAPALPRWPKVVPQCPGVTVVGPLDDPLDLLGLWDGAALAVVVDAVSSGPRPERSRWWSSRDRARAGRERGASGTTSTHGIGLAGV